MHAGTNLQDGSDHPQNNGPVQDGPISQSVQVAPAGPPTFVKLQVGGETACEVDVTTCALQAELFERLRCRGTPTAPHELARCPGGADLLRSAVSHLQAMARIPLDGTPDLHCLTSPPLTSEVLGDYLEAGALLGSPRLVHDLAKSPACEELTSRRALPLLEQVLLMTAEPDRPGAIVVGTSAVTPATTQVERYGPLSDPMEDAFAEAIGQLCSRLDLRDFRLGPALARGSARASLEVLRAYRLKCEDAFNLDATMRSIRSTPTMSVFGTQSGVGSSQSILGSVVEKGSQRVEWTEHQFALIVLRVHVERETEAALQAGTARKPPPALDLTLPGADPSDPPPNPANCSDEELDAFDQGPRLAEGDDITEEICDTAPDSTLKRLEGFATHLEASLTPPVLAAAMVRALLLVRKEDRADALFQSIFPHSPKVRAMVVDRTIPVMFLRGVAKHRAASITLRQMLSRYESADHRETCELIENLFFEELMEEQHSHEVIVRHVLMRHLILWMRSGGRPNGAQTGASGYCNGTASSEGATVQRLRRVGLRLFSVAFVAHRGFLPEDASEECPWDTGTLDFPLLGNAPQTEDSLQLVRRVLLRCYWRRRKIDDVNAVGRLWTLGRWSLCRDPGLIGEAFAMLTACWRAIAGLPGLGDLAGAHEAPSPTSASTTPCTDTNGACNEDLPQDAFDGRVLVGNNSRRTAEERLFSMFTDLEIWRLPHKDLLTPWVPGQVLAGHVAAQCKELEDRQFTLVEETRENLEEIARLHAVINQLTARLEATDSRSQQCMAKQAELNDTLRQLR